MGTGIKVSELINIKLDDLNIANKSKLIVRDRKGRKNREVPVPTEARKAIKRYIEVRPDISDYLLISQNPKGPIKSSSTVFRRLKKYAENVGLEHKMSPNTLRHQYAAEMLKRTDLSTVQKLLGHEYINSTVIYCHNQKGEKVAETANY